MRTPWTLISETDMDQCIEVLAIEDKVRKKPVELKNFQPMPISTNATSVPHTMVNLVSDNSVKTKTSKVHFSINKNTSNKKQRI